MANLNKMKKCELIEYCKELLKGADNKLLEENEKLKKELKEEIKISNKLDLQVYRQDKVLGDYLAINSKLEEDINELKNENEEIKINTMKCCKDLGNKNEELEKNVKHLEDKYTEGYNLLCGAQTSMEEMLVKIEELKKENEELKSN